ncbi:hypothetical protein [Stappia indica]|uniref:hypothetical protein n=1 Tax=Stappia indica TaxID=538381 RepID=UPI001CD223AE|nr:hypothetical protein [Stappia indica]MCA1300592.1 hypothetical protein [Stappia indica]
MHPDDSRKPIQVNEPSENHNTLSKFRLDIPVELTAFLNSAVARIGYLFPTARIDARDGYLEIGLPENLDFDDFRQQLFYSIYREKIREEGKDSRHALNVAVFGQ